jgi:type I restriction enzyme S subunit
MSLPPYPAYEDSGVSWLGEVPKGWSLRKFRHAFRESAEKIEDEVVGPMLSVSGYRGIEIKEYDDENRRRSDEDLLGYRVVRPGQLVVNTMWLNYAGIGVSEHEGHVSPAYRCYWFRGDPDPRYIHHLMRSSIYVQAYTGMLTGIRPNSLQLSRNDLMNLPILLPPRAEQSAIAAFLDRETAKIDALIDDQQRILALLQEKQENSISRIVTRGRDPHSRFRDSGINWLGHIPADWEVYRLARLTDQRRPITYGIVQPGEPDPAGRYMIRGQDYSRGWAREDSVFKVSDVVEEPYRRARLKRGDLVVTIVGAGTGNSAVVPDRFDGANITQTTARVAPDTQRVSGAYLSLLFASKLARVQTALYQKGAAQPGLNLEHLKSFRFPVPPKEEQERILESLRPEQERFDHLSSAAAVAIDLLQERRATLISAAVTGKIDVRGLVAERAEAA